MKAARQLGEMCECVYDCEERGIHGETGAKLDSETSQITCEMKQTTPGKKTKQNKAPEKCRARQAGTKAKKQKQNKHTFLSARHISDLR